MGTLNLNIYNILIIFGITQGVIFSSIVLLNKRFSSYLNNFIVFTVLALSFSNFQYWIDDINSKGFFEIFVDLRIPTDILIVPSFYLFVNSYLNKKNTLNLILLLIFPFFISLFLNLLLYFKLFPSETLRTLNIALEFFSLLFNLLLIVLMMFQIKKYELENNEYNTLRVKSETKWIKQILYFGSIMCLFWFITIIIMQTELNTGLSIYYPLWLSISALIYWISYVAVINSKIIKDRKAIRKSITIQNSLEKNNNKLIGEKIIFWIKNEKQYLNPNLSLNLIAKKFNLSEGYISQLINQNVNTNFNDFINSLRVKEVKKNLMTKEFDQYTILSIGLEAGFNSKSSFYTAFKRVTGKTPNEYKKEVRNL